MTRLTRDQAFTLGLLCSCGGATAQAPGGQVDPRLPLLDDGRRRPLCGCFRRRLRQQPVALVR